MPSDCSQKLDWEKLRGLSPEQIEVKVQEILKMMTLEEKVSQMKGDWLLIPTGIKMIRYNSEPIPAGRNKRLGIPPVLFSDGPRGVVIGNSTCFPVTMARGATWDIALEEKVGNAIGIEARAYGANFYGGVCINLLRHPAWGRAQETYGEDPALLGAMGCALVKGTQKHVMACAKHYACNSMENMRFKVDVSIDERSLREVYLYHFKQCVDAGVASIMSAYNKVNGFHCGHNVHILRDILKNDWGFKGFVMSDFVLGIRNGAAAIQGGLDIEMPFKLFMKPKRVLKALKQGKISEEMIDDAVIRILRQKLRFNLPDIPHLYTRDKIACHAHTQLALDVARKGMVLLKNDSKLLPLNQNEIKKLAVIGKLADFPNIGDHGSSRVHPSYVVTALEGIKKLVGSSLDVQNDSGKNIESARALAQSSDAVIIVAGYSYGDEGEYISGFTGGDRKSIRLHPSDEKLIEILSQANKKCIVVMIGGSAIITESWREKVTAILMAWYPRMEGGNAIAEIIFGKVNPSGKLPVTFPKSETQLPFFDRKAKTIKYDFYHGYWLLEKNKEEPAFPFGFGLSYTTFVYKNLRMENASIMPDSLLSIKIDITNTGSLAGEEIAQAYVGYPNSKVDRPKKQLKGFTKVMVRPGETITVTIQIHPKDLGYYDAENHAWTIEKTQYQLLVGPSSKDQELISTSFNII